MPATGVSVSRQIGVRVVIPRKKVAIRSRIFSRGGPLGHKDVQTTMIYTHVLNRGGGGVVSPLDK
jgi:hypothetical protein